MLRSVVTSIIFISWVLCFRLNCCHFQIRQWNKRKVIGIKTCGTFAESAKSELIVKAVDFVIQPFPLNRFDLTGIEFARKTLRRIWERFPVWTSKGRQNHYWIFQAFFSVYMHKIVCQYWMTRCKRYIGGRHEKFNIHWDTKMAVPLERMIIKLNFSW